MPLTRDAYRNLIREDLAWLVSCPRTLERDHVITIVKSSEAHEYDSQFSFSELTETKRKLAAAEARVKELEVVRHAALELAQYASYAEFVGRVSLNKDHIREWSGKIFKLNLDLGSAMQRKDSTPSTDNK